MEYLNTFQTISSIASPFLLAYIAYITTRKNKLQEQLNDKKRENYEEFIELLNTTVNKMNDVNKSIYNANKVFQFKKKLILFASPKTIKNYNLWLKNTRDKDGEKIFDDVENIILSLREEIGLSNKGLKKYDLVRVLIRRSILKIYKIVK